MGKPFDRLAKHSSPQHYDVSLRVNFEKFTFTGTQSVLIDVKDTCQSTKELVLNAVEIEVQSASYNKSEAQISYQKEAETVTLAFKDALPLGQGTLKMNFTGLLNDKMKGFYRSKYADEKGEEQFMAVTQFEATDARRAFPCWDEPACKATFDVTLIVPRALTALSNMPQTERTPLADDDFDSVKFDRTPIMSTYLLAFAVGKFEYIEDRDSDGVLLRVYTVHGKKDKGHHALQVAKKTLPFYKDYFGIAYPLPKMDLIAVPDFAAGAMENWGLVTYREVTLLVDAENSSKSTMEVVAMVVGHEIAHQWFGNLVTMEWWTDLWLNEGFATWIEYLSVDHCYPDYNIWMRFATNDYARALDLDCLENSHPIEVEVNNPDEIDEIFDAISYSKGSSVIRMLHDWLGDSAFKTGLHNYLSEHKYGNARTADLWKALEASSGKPVTKVMPQWTQRKGYPVVQVSVLSETDTTKTVELSQSRFLLSGDGDKSTKWNVPVTVRCADGSVHKILLVDTQSLTLPKTAWIKVNSDAVGFYRVNYSPTMLEDLVQALKNGQLSQADRFSLQNDLFALATAGLCPVDQVLRLTLAYSGEQFFTVWADLLGNLGRWRVLVEAAGLDEKWSSFLRSLCSAVFKTVGWEAKKGESHDASLLRQLLVGVLGRVGDEQVVAEARVRFQKHVSGEESCPADLRDGVYRTVLRHGGREEFDKLLALLEKSTLQEESMRIQRSLGSSATSELRHEVLQFAISDKVRRQDTVFMIAGVCGSLAGRQQAWKFVQERWPWFVDHFAGQFLLSRLIEKICSDFCTEEDAKSVESFFQLHAAPSAERTIQQALESTRLNVSQLARDRANIEAFLADY